MVGNVTVDSRIAIILNNGERVVVTVYDANNNPKTDMSLDLTPPVGKKFNGMVAVAGILVDE